MSPIRSRALCALLLAAVAACSGERAPVSPDAPDTRSTVRTPAHDALMMIRTPSAPAGERGGSTLQLDAAVHNPVGKELENKRHVEWSSSDESKATVDSTGLVTAQDTGLVSIIVSHKKSSDQVRVLIVPVPVASVALAGAVDSISLDDTLSLTATALDSVGEPLIGRLVTWSSSDAAIADVSDGTVIARGVGDVTITAESEGKSASATVRVWVQPVATVSVVPTAPSVPLYRSITAGVTLLDRRGKVLTGRTITWSTSAPGVLAVTPTSGGATLRGVDVGGATVVARSEGREGSAAIDVTNPVEARALWVTRFDYTTSTAVIPGRIAQIMQKAAQANFNIVYFQVRTAADALYPSTLEPCSPRVCGALGNAFTGPDPLQTALTEAARYGIEVHAWLNAYTGWIAGNALACNQLNSPNGGNHMVRRHPDWVMVNSSGTPMPCLTGSEYIWVSPGIDSVRTRLAAVAADVARRYGPSGLRGIHLDRIRYPGTAWSYDTASVNAYRRENPTGSLATFATAWGNFRRGLVNRGVREVADSIRAIDRSMVISAAVFPAYQPVPGWAAQWGYTDLLQDPLAWAREGSMDVAVPMAYPALPTSTSWTVKTPYCANVDWTCALDQQRARIEGTGQRHVYIGVGAIRGWDEMARQLDIGHGRGVNGFSVFDYSKVEAIPSAWARLAAGPFKYKATIPPMDWK